MKTFALVIKAGEEPRWFHPDKLETAGDIVPIGHVEDIEDIHVDIYTDEPGYQDHAFIEALHAIASFLQLVNE